MRELKRARAKWVMKKNGMIRLCSHHGNRGHGSKGSRSDSGNRSYFAAHWREFV